MYARGASTSTPSMPKTPSTGVLPRDNSDRRTEAPLFVAVVATAAADTARASADSDFAAAFARDATATAAATAGVDAADDDVDGGVNPAAVGGGGGCCGYGCGWPCMPRTKNSAYCEVSAGSSPDVSCPRPHLM